MFTESIVSEIATPVFEQLFDFFLDDRQRKKMRAQIDEASKHYEERYKRRHGDIKILSMRKSVPVDDIYVLPAIKDEEILPNLLEPQTLQEVYDTERNRGNRELDFSQQRGKKTSFKGINIVNRENRLMVLGGPGAGKSTFLRSVGLEALKGKAGEYQHGLIPIFLELKYFDGPDITLEKKMEGELDIFNLAGIANGARIFLIEGLKKGIFLVILDALDEVAPRNRHSTLSQIEKFVDQYDQNRFIISCRTACRTVDQICLNDFSEIEVQSFDDEQIQQFIENWFNKDEHDRELRIADKFWNLLNRPENASTRELSKTPLLLALICMSYDRSQNLPRNRTSLYKKALDVMLEEWSASKRIKVDNDINALFPIDDQKALLSEIACRSLAKKQLFFERDKVLCQIENYSRKYLGDLGSENYRKILEIFEVDYGILIDQGNRIFSFSHLTIQEFLTARYLFQRGYGVNSIGRVIQKYFADQQRWGEVIGLLAGLQDDASLLVQKIEKRARYFITEDPKLFHSLTWVDQITSDASQFKPFMRRAVAILLVLELIRTFSFIRQMRMAIARANQGLTERERIDRLQLSRQEDQTRYQDLEAAVNLVKIIIMDQALQTDWSFVKYAEQLIRSDRRRLRLSRRVSAHSLSEYLAVNFKFLTLVIQELQTEGLVRFENSSRLLHGLNKLRIRARFYEKGGLFYKEFERQFEWLCLNYLEMKPDMLRLSANELNKLEIYLRAHILILQCKQATSISRPKWQQIEGRILKV
ncbi:MAG: NACHT domain-containing protein [Cyanobacteria bacterium P01_A01_bin.114]